MPCLPLWRLSRCPPTAVNLSESWAVFHSLMTPRREAAALYPKNANVAATVAALTSLDGRKVIILGGRGKGEDYGSLANAVQRGAEAVILLGEEALRIRLALESKGYTKVIEAADMKEAVARAFKVSPPGGMVLLSPACTSWDMYANYAEKGEDFRRCVIELKREQS